MRCYDIKRGLKMGRKKQYSSDAEKQAAYRERERASSERRNPDVRVPAWELHAFLKDRAAEGSFDAVDLLGEMPADTLRNVLEHFKARLPMELPVFGAVPSSSAATPKPKQPPKPHKKLPDVDLGEFPKRKTR